MKATRHKKIIIFNAVISIILIAGLISIFIFILNLNKASLNKIRNINSQITKINNKNSQINKKLLDLEKYEKNWKNLPRKSKSTKLLKSSDVKKIVNATAEKYHIQDIQFALKIPTKLTSGKFKKQSIEIFVASGSISFAGSDDYKSLMFANELFSSLPGNIIIESLSLTKTRSYSSKDYVTISKKGSLSKIKTRIKFHWYSKREITKKKTK